MPNRVLVEGVYAILPPPPYGLACGAILLCDLRPRGLAEADVWPALDFQAIRLAFARRCLGATFAAARSL